MISTSHGTLLPLPTVMPLGDAALLVRFGDALSEPANVAATAFANALAIDPVDGIVEVVPNLVSVLLRYDSRKVQLGQLTGEVRLRLANLAMADTTSGSHHLIGVRFGGQDGPDLEAVATALQMTPASFIASHNASALRVLATGFAPGFVYCGFHPPSLQVPRRTEVRTSVSAGSVLFAAGQTAIAATSIPTGWHLIGTTTFRNFAPSALPPTVLRAGDTISFECAD